MRPLPPGDPGAIAEAVAGLAADPAARRRMGFAARLSVADRTWAAIGDELIEHYHAAIGLPVPDLVR